MPPVRGRVNRFEPVQSFVACPCPAHDTGTGRSQSLWISCRCCELCGCTWCDNISSCFSGRSPPSTGSQTAYCLGRDQRQTEPPVAHQSCLTGEMPGSRCPWRSAVPMNMFSGMPHEQIVMVG